MAKIVKTSGYKVRFDPATRCYKVLYKLSRRFLFIKWYRWKPVPMSMYHKDHYLFASQEKAMEFIGMYPLIAEYFEMLKLNDRSWQKQRTKAESQN